MHITQVIHTNIAVQPKNRGLIEFTAAHPENRVRAVIAYVQTLACDGLSHKVEAVKFVREQLGIGLREAVGFVEACYEADD